MKSRFFRSGFTLAEIMIVLMVIGIISAILLPIAHHATPDENILKFKKANATLGNVIRELVTSDKYYLNGDLGTRADGTLINETSNELTVYFCQTIAEIINTKEVNCSPTTNTGKGSLDIRTGEAPLASNNYAIESTEETISKSKALLDEVCSAVASSVGREIVAGDDTIYYQGNPHTAFGTTRPLTGGIRMFSEPGGQVNLPDQNGFDAVYKIYCIDIDGINQGEDPFGYGIRADGKILYGKRAEEWMQKSIQEKD